MKPHPSDKLPDTKRTELFRRAVAEFSTQGYKRASLNRIIAGMGMSKSSFYHYFSNKADLFQQALDHSLLPYLVGYEGFDFDALQADTFWPELQVFIRAQTLSANRSPDLKTISQMIRGAFEDPEEHMLTHNLFDFYARWLVTLIQRGQALGLVRDDLPEELLVATLMGFSTAFDRWIIERLDRLSDDEVLRLADTATDAYRRLLQPGPLVSP